MAVAALLVVMATVQGAAAQQRRVALVIGNGTYAAGGHAPSAEANARVMGEALRAAGFEVTVATDLTRAAMTGTIGRFQEKLAAAELGFVYYSGLMLAMDGRSVMVPVDARLASEFDVVFETVPLEATLERVRQVVGRAVVVIDPIVPNPFVERLAAVTGAAGRSLRPMADAPAAAGGLLLAYSHQPGRTPVLVGGSGPGAYAAALAEAIRRPGTELREALATAEGHVSQQSGGRQLPWVRDGLEEAVTLGPAAPPVAAALAEAAVDPMAENQMVVRDTNMRAGPGMEASVLRAVRRGTTVAVTGRVRGSSWLRVTVEGQTGYIVARNLASPDAVPPVDEAPVAATPDARPEPAAELAPGVYALSRPATLFAQPVLGARGLRELEAGQLVTVTGTVPGTNWVQARDRFGQEGYVGAGALTSIWGAVGESRSDGGVPAAGGGLSAGDGRAVSVQPLPEPPPATVAAAPSAAGAAVRDAVETAR
ncbi:SH3 domain-containing protein, partial [Azospirillum sp. RWY-5-1]